MARMAACFTSFDTYFASETCHLQGGGGGGGGGGRRDDEVPRMEQNYAGRAVKPLQSRGQGQQKAIIDAEIR